MNSNFYLMRHAISLHNIQKQRWKSSTKHPSPKQSPQYLHFKYRKQLIDPSIHPLPQNNLLRQELDLCKIELILCSPLRRCLQTCTEIIKNTHRKYKIIVEPYLATRLSSAWAIGSNISNLEMEFPGFDYSAFHGIQQTWMASFLQKPMQFFSRVKDKNIQINSLMLSLLQNNGGQTHEAFYERIKELKKRLKRIMQMHNKGDILIISHSCVLNALVAKKRNQKGKLKSKEGFPHCKPKKFSAKDFLQAETDNTTISSTVKAKL